MAFAKSQPSSAANIAAVEAALRGGDLAAAMRLSDEAVTAGAEHPTLLSLAGLKRMGAGDHEGALPPLQRARELSPRHVGTLDALGQCLAQLERGREALAMFDAALAIAPDARLHFNKAMALEELSELDAARTEFERAITRKPDHAEALGRLALLAAQRGDVGAARSFARRCLTLAPQDPVAHIALVLAALEQKAYAAAEAQVQALLHIPNLSPVNAAFANSLAGDILDAQDRPAEAFTAYVAAKADQRAAYAPAMARLAETMPARERRLADYFRAAAPEDWREAKPPQSPRTHVFLVGFPRSGTTLLEQVLASHGQVEAMEERACLADSAREFFGADAGLDRLATLSGSALEPWRQAYWRRVAEAGAAAAKPVFIDKLPLNLVFLPLIAKLFPEAKILLALRDPRDVVLSCFRRRFAMNAGMY